MLTQPQPISDPARRLLSCLDQVNVPSITLLGTTDVPSHKLPMAQLKFKDCGFSIDLGNQGISSYDLCHIPTQEPTGNRQMYPRLRNGSCHPLLFAVLQGALTALVPLQTRVRCDDPG